MLKSKAFLNEVFSFDIFSIMTLQFLILLALWGLSLVLRSSPIAVWPQWWSFEDREYIFSQNSILGKYYFYYWSSNGSSNCQAYKNCLNLTLTLKFVWIFWCFFQWKISVYENIVWYCRYLITFFFWMMTDFWWVFESQWKSKWKKYFSTWNWFLVKFLTLFFETPPLRSH